MYVHVIVKLQQCCFFWEVLNTEYFTHYTHICVLTLRGRAKMEAVSKTDQFK